MHTMISAACLAAACGVILSLVVPAEAAAGKSGLAMETAPNVYGGGILFAYSGLDGKTSWTEPCVASTTADGLGLKFHLPRDPVLSIRLPAPGLASLEWQLVTNDLIVAKVAWDSLPLVVGFTASNVVVGRLPPSCRVVLEGGDPGAALMRNSVGDRTQFAFVYEAKGAKAAAATAAQALSVSIDTLVEARMDFFAAVPKAPENTDPLRAKTLAKAFSVLKVNVYAPEPPIAVRWTTPDRWPERDMCLWTSAFHALGLMHMDIRLAKEALGAVYGFQKETGFIPHRMSPGQPSEISQPPVLAWAAWQAYTFDKMRDRDFLKRSFDATQRHVTWFMKTHRLDGEPPPEKPLEHGTPLYAWKSAEESGAENSPRFDGGAQFAAVDLSAYLASECWMLQNMAQQLSFRELAKTWGQRGDAIAEAARKQLWDNERGFFFDRKAPDGEFISVWSHTGFLPLWAGIATPEQAKRLRDHLVSKKFWTATPVPSVARDDPTYKNDMWRGPAWANVNYLIIRGLQRHGFAKEAADLRDLTLSAVAEWYGKTGAVHEFYDCDGKTPPPELDRKGPAVPGSANWRTISDYNWTAAIYADLLLRPKP